MLVCASAVFFGRHSEPRRSVMLFCVLLLTMLLQVADVFAYLYRGNETTLGYYVVRISNFMVFYLMPALVTGVAEYIFACEPNEVKIKKILRRIVWGVTTVYALILIVSQFTGLIYTFDAANVYHRAQFFWLTTAVGTLMLLCLAVIILIYRKYLSTFETVSMSMLIVLPLVTNIFQFFHYGLSLNNFAIMIAILLLFMTYEIEKGKRVARQAYQLMEQKATISEQKNQITISQIQPHFIFNVLGSIEQLCRVDPARAETATHQFARYLRSNLNAMSKNPMASFSEELQLLHAYFWLEKMRFGDDIQIYEDIRVSSFSLPLMSIQPLVENAVKHGMRDEENAVLNITIHTRENREAYIVLVTDDGVGFDLEQVMSDGRLHVGLNNVRDRIESLAHGNVKIESRIGVGTSVVITLPKPEEKPADEA